MLKNCYIREVYLQIMTAEHNLQQILLKVLQTIQNFGFYRSTHDERCLFLQNKTLIAGILYSTKAVRI